MSAAVAPVLGLEHRILAAAATPTPGDVSMVDAASVRWPRLVDLAERHRLGPLLSRWASQGPLADAVPDDVVAQLRKSRFTTGARNLLLQTELGRVSRSLAADGIPSMALKGAALIENVYSDISLRPMLDLDILVPSADIGRAESVLLGLGYESDPRRGVAELDRHRRSTKYAYPMLIRARPPTAIDLHRNLAQEFPELDIDALWTRAGPAGPSAHLLPSPEDLLLHVGIHFFKDRLRYSEGSFGQLADIAWIIDRCPIDWDALARTARESGVGGRLFLTLSSARDLMSVPVPPRFLDGLSSRAPSPVLTRRFVARRVVGTTPWHPPRYFSPLPAESFDPRPRPLRRVLPSRDYLQYHYGTGTPDASYGNLYMRRLAGAARVLRPWMVPEDLVLTRWMRSFDTDARTGTGSGPAAPGAETASAARSPLGRLAGRARGLTSVDWWETLVALGLTVVVEIGLRTIGVARLAPRLGVRLDMSAGPAPTPYAGVLPRWAGVRLRAVSRVLRRWPFGDTCLRRCLVAGHRLRGLAPSLRIGAAAGEDGFLIHSWLEIEGGSLDPSASKYLPLQGSPGP